MTMLTRLLATAATGAIAAAAMATAAKAQELSFWSWRQEDRAIYEELIADFEAENPGIDITFEAFEPQNYATILSTALAADRGPDLMMVRAYGAFEALAEPGYLMAIDEESVPELANFPADAIRAETLRSDGQVYAVPFASQTMLVIYNRDIFEEHGLEEPETWDDLLAICAQLQETGLYPFANGTATAWQNETIVGALLSSQIGRQFEEDIVAGEATFEDARFVDALERLNNIKQYFAPSFVGVDYDTSRQLFAAGQAAMFAGGSFEIANFRAQNPDLDLGIFASPVLEEGDERLVAIFYDGGYAANAGTEHADAALAFLRYVGSPEFADPFANQLGNVSPVEGVEFRDPLLAEVAELNRNAMSYIMLVHFRYQEPSGSVLIQSEVQRMMADETTPDQVGTAVTEGIANYYEPFQQ